MLNSNFFVVNSSWDKLYSYSNKITKTHFAASAVVVNLAFFLF